MAVTRADRKAIAEERDQLWAEAVAAFRDGERWWLSDDMERVAGEEQAERQDAHPWTAKVLGIVETRSEVSTRYILTVLFKGDDVEKQTRQNATFVAGILRRNGWVTEGRFAERGPNHGLTRFVRSDSAPIEAVKWVVEPPQIPDLR